MYRCCVFLVVVIKFGRKWDKFGQIGESDDSLSAFECDCCVSSIDILYFWWLMWLCLYRKSEVPKKSIEPVDVFQKELQDWKNWLVEKVMSYTGKKTEVSESGLFFTDSECLIICEHNSTASLE